MRAIFKEVLSALNKYLYSIHSDDCVSKSDSDVFNITGLLFKPFQAFCLTKT